MAHLEVEWLLQLYILFFLFHYFSSSTFKRNFGRTVARKSAIGGLHVCARGQDVLKIYI